MTEAREACGASKPTSSKSHLASGSSGSLLWHESIDISSSCPTTRSPPLICTRVVINAGHRWPKLRALIQ